MSDFCSNALNCSLFLLLHQKRCVSFYDDKPKIGAFYAICISFVGAYHNVKLCPTLVGSMDTLDCLPERKRDNSSISTGQSAKRSSKNSQYVAERRA